MLDQSWLEKATNAAKNLYGLKGCTGHSICRWLVGLASLLQVQIECEKVSSVHTGR